MSALKMHKNTGKRRQKGTEANEIMKKKTERILITQTKRYKDKRKKINEKNATITEKNVQANEKIENRMECGCNR